MSTINLTGTATGGGFNMSFWSVGLLLSQIANIFNTSNNGTLLVYPAPGAELRVTGTFGAFNTDNDPTTGTINSFRYANLQGGVERSAIEFVGLSLSVPTVFGWVETNNTAAAQAALLDIANTINGSAFNDFANGFGGDDLINAIAGNDTLNGGLGNDTLNGGDGNDTIDDFGLGEGNDLIDGGDGDDILRGAGIDTLDGGNGTDFVRLSLTGSGVTVALGDFATASGVTLSNGMIVRNIERADVFATNGDDTFNLTGYGGGGAVRGGAGIDTLRGDFSAVSGSSGIDLNPGNPNLIGQLLYPNFARTEMESIERLDVIGTAQADRILGASLGDTIQGGGGNDGLVGNGGDDQISGGLGNDSISGDAGNDSLSGGDGNDTLFGGEGVDTLDGGDGVDVASVVIGGTIGQTYRPSDFSAPGGVTLANGGIVRNIEAVDLTAGSGDDTFILTASDPLVGGFRGAGGVDTVVFNFAAATGDYRFAPWAINGPNASSMGFFDIERITVNAGAGNDELSGGALADTLNGGLGNDSINGGDGNDIADGGAGLDRLFGGAGADSLNGGDGDDTMDGGGGLDTLDGGAGFDTASISWTGPAGVSLSLVDLAAPSGFVAPSGAVYRNFETASIAGGEGDDTLTIAFPFTGGGGFFGGGGTDTLIVDMSASQAQGQGFTLSSGWFAGPNSEAFRLEEIERVRFLAGAGDDMLFGRVGNDTLSGGAGFDRLTGFDGDDVLDGGAGQDELTGGAGLDVASYASATGAVTVSVAITTAQDTGGGGIDTLSQIEGLIGSDFNDLLTGDGGANLLDGGAGLDTLNGGAGNDTYGIDTTADVIIDTGGNDTILTQFVNVNIANFAGMENITLAGSANGDAIGDAIGNVLTGNAGANQIFGFAGNDTLNGGAGVDSIYGGADNDTLNGNDGIDLLFGEAGADIANGGAGNDLVLGGDGNDTVNGDDGVDTVLGEAGDDVVNGQGGGDVLWGGLGVDTVNGGDGIDYLYGQDGNDQLNGGADVNIYIGGDGNDVMGSGLGLPATNATQIFYGEAGANLVSGGVVGNDSATGGTATDWFIMEAGDDTMRGGAGNDMFYGGDGNDLVDMREGAPGAPASGDYAWGYAGADTFVTQVGQAGVEVIMDFQAGAGAGDVVQILGSTYTNFNQLLAAAIESGGFTIIPLGGAEAVYLWNVTKAQLVADDFAFS
jgi:Ca2+-binding RTX toxin-like protein